MHKRSWVLMLAAALAVFFLPAAFASEGGLFARMIDTEYADDRLARLDEIAETVSLRQAEGDTAVEVSQAYCEGDRVYVSYRADGRFFEEDGLELEAGSYADIAAGGSVLLEDGSTIGWKECILPEDAPADIVTFRLVYRTSERGEPMTLAFTLKRNTYGQCLQGISAAADYDAQAVLYAGRADLKGLVTLTSPQQAAAWLSWQMGGDGTGTDVIVCWDLYRDGELLSFDLCGKTEVNGTEGVTYAFMFPYTEDLDGLALVPEYGSGGEQPGEAILLEPAARQ